MTYELSNKDKLELEKKMMNLVKPRFCINFMQDNNRTDENGYMDW